MVARTVVTLTPWSYNIVKLCSVQFSHSVMSDCDPMDCSTPGLPIHHQLPELEVTDISPGNPDSCLCFIQPGISHDVLCIST